MATPITISISHRLGRVEARRRIEAGFEKVIDLIPGAGVGACKKRWDGDRLTFEVATLGQTVAGVVLVLEDVVTMEITLHGVLALVAQGLKERLHKATRLVLTSK